MTNLVLDLGWMKPWILTETKRHQSVDSGVRYPRAVSTWGPKIPPAVGRLKPHPIYIYVNMLLHVM